MKKVMKVVFIIIFIVAIIIGAGFSYLYNNGLSGQYANTEPKEGQIKVACVGDSITYGHGIKGWSENNYPAVLQTLLGDEYHVANFGSSGACINPEGDQPYISREVYQNSLDYDADILVIMLGTNDSKPENWTDVEGFMEDYMTLLESYLEGENPPEVYIGLCAEAYYTEDADQSTGIANYDIQPAIVDEMVAEMTAYLEEHETVVHIIDIHTLTEEHAEWFEADGIHPSNDGAKAIAEMVADAIK